MEYKEPFYMSDAFNCPFCNAYSHQKWRLIIEAKNMLGSTYHDSIHVNNTYICTCEKCKKHSIWIYQNNQVVRMVYPLVCTAPLASPDMPKDCINDYNEARNIFTFSPKASAALLRLVLQKLCINLGEEGKHLNTDIANLIKNGLPPSTQKAFDIVRVVGNNAVHPGEICIDDNEEIAFMLFKLINIIVEYMITRPKEIDDLYDILPEEVRNGIEKRDRKK
ncbi:MAG: DUF4145 domain-containing protein [Bacillota bacterium]